MLTYFEVAEPIYGYIHTEEGGADVLVCVSAGVTTAVNEFKDLGSGERKV